ncbi:MAG: sigma-70 family RNA polymerase sigma factor [Myxococcales bacterium]|nr:sigma-70 family RNA polymerase sigma factor [Myxococcales bacterium]
MTPSSQAKPSSDGTSNILAPYLREMASVPLMSPQEERAAALKIESHRADYWAALLAYPPFVKPIAALAREVLELPPEVESQLAHTARCARALRDRNLTRNRVAFESARAQLAKMLGLVDLDGLASDRVLADLNALLDGSAPALSLDMRRPPQGSKPFELYVMTARKHSQLLWSAKNRFVKANLRLVITLVRRIGRGRLPLQDLIQEGNIGLMKAVDRFDPRKGVRFSTYAAWWIRHSVSRAIADKSRTVRIPVHMLELQAKVRKATRAFEAANGRAPTQAELARELKVKRSRLAQLNHYLLEQPLSLDVTPGNDGDYSILESLEDPSSPRPDEYMADAELLDSLREGVDALPTIEADVLRKRMGLGGDKPMTLREIGEQYSLSRERIRQIQGKALRTLRERLEQRAAI